MYYLSNRDELLHHLSPVFDLGLRQNHGTNPRRDKVEMGDACLERSRSFACLPDLAQHVSWLFVNQ